jgi:Cu-processing system permease protein
MLALLNPLQIFKIAAIWNIRDSLEVLGPAGLYALRTFSDSFLTMLISILAAWTVIPLLITSLILSKKGAL